MKSRFTEIEAKLGVAVQDAVKDAAERIAAQAKVSAPVRTGRLKESIDTRPGYGQTGVRGPGARYDVVAIWYWFLQEFGTVNQAAQPFMIPAVEAERPRMIAEVERKLRDL